MKKNTKKTAKKPAAKSTTVARDPFGGRIGTRMSKINMALVDAKAKGITVPEVAEITRETASIVSAQLGWLVSHKKVATRREEQTDAGKKTFRYFAKTTKK